MMEWISLAPVYRQTSGKLEWILWNVVYADEVAEADVRRALPNEERMFVMGMKISYSVLL